jgi:hypothetical protein
MEAHTNRIIIYLLLVFSLAIISRPKLRIDWLFVVFIAASIISEISSYLATNYGLSNLDVYSIDIGFNSFLLTYILNLDIRKPVLLFTIAILIALESLLQVVFNFSAIGIISGSLYVENEIMRRTIMFFELGTFSNLLITLLIFYWVWWIVNSSNLEPRLVQKRYFYAFSHLIFYGGAFFIMSLPRMIMPSNNEWSAIWGKVFIPIYVVFYIGILIGILWKTTPTSSSQRPSLPS